MAKKIGKQSLIYAQGAAELMVTITMFGGAGSGYRSASSAFLRASAARKSSTSLGVR